ncbi:MAG TPA: NADH-ubiquinone oxidoreductase-F iron-sulfur binding region domain-containing protein [Actinomycetales bacterium]|nr:NADH-ubiquinone oxidoreductase-F iron-sulfur binding region domain-containing protein [Actinomycetales bacterium]
MTAAADTRWAAPSGVARLTSFPTQDPQEHIDVFGPLPAIPGELVLRQIETSGLTGRGGGGFPTAAKLRALAGRRGAVVVGNGNEGEPLSEKDAWLLSWAPNLVLDGLLLAARAVGARRSYLATSRPELAEELRDVVRMRGDRIEVALSERRFVSGEESAVVSVVGGGPALPRDKLVRVYERGVRGRPTLVCNVETLAHLALIARFGAGWFRSAGMEDEPGTMLVTAAGAIGRPGVFEAPMGMPLTSLLEGMEAEPPRAVLLGGFHGGWIPGRAVERLDLSRKSLSVFGSSPGAGVVMVLGRADCGLMRSSAIATYLARQSTGQCGPCVNGLPRMADTLDRLAHGVRDRRLVTEVDRLRDLVAGRGACSHPDGTARFVGSTMKVFADEVDLHLAGGCSASAAR